MGSKSMPKLPLPLAESEKSMPVIGLGTFPSAGSEATKEAILNAIRAGYTHFDTAAAYNTEQFLGEAISEALSLGLINSRDDFSSLPSSGVAMHILILCCLPFITLC